jgi:hypothetical protein
MELVMKLGGLSGLLKLAPTVAPTGMWGGNGGLNGLLKLAPTGMGVC